VQRIWRAHGLQPHRARQLKLSNDPKFVDKARDVVGLYVDPPAHAIDEKSQIQALDRNSTWSSLKAVRAGTMTHDYQRHGTTMLFAALNEIDGTVIGRFSFHFTPTWCSWLNAVESFFAKLTKRLWRCGVFVSVVDL
jgi:hypothetical protein